MCINQLKGTVSVIFSDPPCTGSNARFKKPKSDQQLWNNFRVIFFLSSHSKSVFFSVNFFIVSYEREIYTSHNLTE